MAAWTSIRSININNWNENKVTVAGNTEKAEVGDVFEDPSYSISLVLSLVVLAVVGKLNKYSFDWNYIFLFISNIW